MGTIGPVPRFRDTEVVVDFDPAVPPDDAVFVMGGIRMLISRLVDIGVDVEALVDALPQFVLRYGYVARLTERRQRGVTFAIGRQ